MYSRKKQLTSTKVFIIQKHIGTVDSLDKMFKEYSCNRNTKRRPLDAFFNFVNIGAINAFVLYTDKFNDYEKGPSFRKKFFL